MKRSSDQTNCGKVTDRTHHNGAIDVLRRFAVMALLVPFLLLSLFSNGTMLTRTADHRVTVVLCIGAGQVEMVWGKDGSLTPASEAPAPNHDDSTGCDWQAAAQAALLAALGDVPPTILAAVKNSLLIDVPLHTRRMNVLAASARGPPRQV